MTGSVRRRGEFERLRREGRRSSSGAVTVIHVPDPAITPPRFAFSIPRKVGSAVRRNRLRRQVRAVLGPLDPPAGLYLIMVRRDVGPSPVPDVRRALERLAA